MSNSQPSREEFHEFLATDLEIGVAIAKLNKRRATNMAQYEGIGGDRDEIRVGRKLDRLGADYLHMVGRVGSLMGLLTVEDDGQGSFASAFEAPSTTAYDNPDGRMFLIRANGDGFNSACHGSTQDDNPHPAGSEVYDQWARGCREGMAEREKMVAAKEAKKERAEGVTHIDPATLPHVGDTVTFSDGVTGTFTKVPDKPKRGRPRKDKGLTPNGPTAEDVAEQTADAHPAWDEFPEPPGMVQ